jgi:TPR repeat protein
MSIQFTVLSLTNLNPLISQGMKILIHFREDKKKQKESFQFFLQCADQFQDPEAFWRLSACYYRGIGVKEDKNKSFEYAQKAKEKGSIEGTFWFAVNCWWKHNDQEALLLLHQLAEQGHLASFFWEGLYEYYGDGIQQNIENGKRKMFLVLTSNDGFWTFIYSDFLLMGSYGISKDKEKGNELRKIWKTQPISEFNYFLPYIYYHHPWQK